MLTIKLYEINTTYFIKTSSGAFGVGFYNCHGWFDIVTAEWGSDKDKILLWMEILSVCKIARDYNGKEISQSVARDFSNMGSTSKFRSQRQ